MNAADIDPGLSPADLRREADRRERLAKMTELAERLAARRTIALGLLDMERSPDARTAYAGDLLRRTVLALHDVDKADRSALDRYVSLDRVQAPGPASGYECPVAITKDFTFDIPHGWRPR